MAERVLICFPTERSLGLRADAAQLALGLAECGGEIIALGPLGSWRHPLRMAKINAHEFNFTEQGRKAGEIIQDYDPHVIHAFGADTAHLVLPIAAQLDAGGAATLGHADLTRINPTVFRSALAVFVSCDYLREQLMRRLPTIPVVTTGYLLPPPTIPEAAKNRFLAAELGIHDGAPVVLLADQFRGSETDAALALLEAAPLIAEKFPTVQIVIAGDGLRLGELENQAIEVNNRLGRRAVLLPALRDDIDRLLSLATVAVGSGRFAAEALGAGVATIAAGPAGLVGTVTEDTMALAEFTCFSRHGRLEPLTEKALAIEINGLLTYADYREHFAREGSHYMLGKYGRTQQSEQIAAAYQRSPQAGVVARAPQTILARLPGNLRELLFCLPVISGLHRQFPQARLHLIAPPAHHRLLRHLVATEQLLAIPRRLRELPGLFRAVYRLHPELFLAFTSELYAHLAAGCSLAPHRVGYAEGGASILLTGQIHSRLPASPARALLLVQEMGVVAGALPSPPALPMDIREAADISLLAQGIDPGTPLILLAPEARASAGWPPAHWGQLQQRLLAHWPGAIAMLDGDGLALLDGVASLAPVPDSLLLAGLLARASLVIAPDSAVLHLADLLGMPTIGLFGPTSPDLQHLPGSTGIRLCHTERTCHPCHDNDCADRRCLQDLTPDEVFAAIRTVLVPSR